MKPALAPSFGAISLALTVAFTSTNSSFSADCDHVLAIEAFMSTGTPPKGALCSTYTNQGAGTSVSCYWDFPFRDDAANRQATMLWSMLQRCHVGVKSTPDLRVNHPDSYRLKEWKVGSRLYSVSVKDKGALNKTLVFFRFE